MKKFLCLVFVVVFLPPLTVSAAGKGKHRLAPHTRSAKRLTKAQRRAQIALAHRREAAARAFELNLRRNSADSLAKDNPVGENLAVREVAKEALGSRAGTVLVMDAQNGNVLTMLNQQWGVRDSFKPCSTIKLVTAVAGIGEQVIDDTGAIKGQPLPLHLDVALAKSSNVYFQAVGAQLGTEKMVQYARHLGLGEFTGINVPGETPGKLPHGRSTARIYSHGDGFEVTPLQLATMVTIIANGGRKVAPHINNTALSQAPASTQADSRITIPAAGLSNIIRGMKGATEYGTAKTMDPSLRVAGKTGSCLSKGTWIGLFVSVAPVEKPKYAVVVITRGRGERGRLAASIADKIYHQLLAPPPAPIAQNTEPVVQTAGQPIMK